MKPAESEWEHADEIEGLLAKKNPSEADVDRGWSLLGALGLLPVLTRWLGPVPVTPALAALILRSLRVENFGEKEAVVHPTETKAFLVLRGSVGLFRVDQNPFLTNAGMSDQLTLKLNRVANKLGLGEALVGSLSGPSGPTSHVTHSGSFIRPKKFMSKLAKKSVAPRLLECSSVFGNKHAGFNVLMSPNGMAPGLNPAAKSAFGVMNPINKARFEAQNSLYGSMMHSKQLSTEADFQGKRYVLDREVEYREVVCWTVPERPKDDPPVYLTTSPARVLGVTREDVEGCVKLVNEKELLEKQKVLSESFSVAVHELPLKVVQAVFEGMEVG